MPEDNSISQERASEEARAFWDGLADSFQNRRGRGRAVVSQVIRDNAGRAVSALASIDGSVDQPIQIDHGQILGSGDIFLVENDGTVSLPQWRTIRKLLSVSVVPQATELPTLPTPTNLILYTGAFMGTPGLPVWAWIGATWDTLDSARWGSQMDYELEYCPDEKISDPERLRINYQQSSTYAERAITASDTIIPRHKFEGGLDDHDKFPFAGKISLGSEKISYETMSNRISVSGAGGTGGKGILTDITQNWSTDIFLEHCLVDAAFNVFLITGNDAQAVFFSGECASGNYVIYPCFAGCVRGIEDTVAIAHNAGQRIVSKSAGGRFSGLLPGVTYNVRVRAIRFDGAISGWTTWQSIVVHIDEEAPPTPWGFTATSIFSGVLLEWEGPIQEDTPDLAGFYVWESDDATGDNENWITVIGARTETLIHVDRSVVPRYYCIQAVDSSNNVSAKTERLAGQKQPSGGRNLLPNSDFEVGVDGVPDYWKPKIQSTGSILHGDYGIDGGKGCLFSIPKGGGYITLHVPEPLSRWKIPSEVGVHYTCSFYYKVIVGHTEEWDLKHTLVYKDRDPMLGHADGTQLFVLRAWGFGHDSEVIGLWGNNPVRDPGVISETVDGWTRVEFTYPSVHEWFYHRRYGPESPEDPDVPEGHEVFKYLGMGISLLSYPPGTSRVHPEGVDVSIAIDNVQFEMGSEATAWGLASSAPQGQGLRIDPSSITGQLVHLRADGSFYSNILPSYDYAFSLGASDRRWKNIWGQTIYTENILNMEGDPYGLTSVEIGTVYGGKYACKNITSPGANYNTVIGYEAMRFNETGDRNCIFGYQAGYGVSGQSYEDNVLIGSQAGYGLTNGYYNILIGTEVAKTGTTISENIILGYKAAHSATTGIQNTIIGVQAAEGITDGMENVCIGYWAGRSANFGGAIGNVIIGDSAGYTIDGTSGAENVLIGYMTGFDLTTGWGNVFVGAYSGQHHTIGDINTFIGYETGEFNTEGEEGVFVGYLAGQANTTEHYNTYIGSYAGTELRGTYNVAVGRYAGAGGRYTDYNVFVGGGAGQDCYDGGNNVCVGYNAGMSTADTSYSNNVLVGFEAGKGITTGGDNVFMGYQAGLVATTAYRNVVIGSLAADSMTTSDAYNNVIIGYHAGEYLTTGPLNTIVGAEAGRRLTNEGANVFIGHAAGAYTDTGVVNTAVGAGAHFYNDGSWNVVLGRDAGYGDGVSTTSYDATVLVGYQAGYALSTGDNNVFMGYQAGQAITVGGSNVFVGYQAGYGATEEDSSVFIGYQAAFTHGGDDSVVIGCHAGYLLNGNASENVVVGRSAAQDATSMNYSVIVGGAAGAALTYEMYCTFVGYGAGGSAGSLGGTADYNTYIGAGAGSYNDGYENACVGYDAGRGHISAASYNFCIAIGNSAGIGLTTGHENVLVGYESGKALTTGEKNVLVGYRAGLDAIDGYLNVALGHQTGLELTAGAMNTFLGSQAGGDCKTGDENTLVGYASGFTGSATDQSGDNNVAVGAYSASALTTAADNVLLGWGAADTLTTHTNNVFIGCNVGHLAATSGSVLIGYAVGESCTADNRLYIHNSNTTTPLIYGEFDTPMVKVHGDLHIHTGYGLKHDDGVAVGKVLIADGTRYIPGDSPGATFANPTASVGLTAINGVLTTAMRSDAAPPLDQGIAPTWTGIHNFSDNIIQADAKNIQTDQVRARDGDGLKLYDDGGNGIFVEDGGFVGIGTEDPTCLLDVEGASPIISLNATSGSGNFLFEENGTWKYSLYYSAASNWFGLYSTDIDGGGTDGDIFRVPDGGNAVHFLGHIGIGTATPDLPLTFDSGAGGKIQLADGYHYDLGIQTNIMQFIIPASAQNFVFGHGTSASLTELMRLQGDGKLGIGAAAPGSLTEWNMATEDLEFVDAGSAGAAQQDWVEVQIGGVTGYIHIHAGK